MDQDCQQKSMNDAVGATVVVGDSVAYYNTTKGRTIFGKILRFNSASMIIQPVGTSKKSSTVRKNSTQVVKVSIEVKKIIPRDSLGNEIKIGDFVAMTPCSNVKDYRRSSFYNRNLDYNGKIVFGEIKKLCKSSVEVRLINKNKLLRKSPSQLIKVSEEQMTLIFFSL
jgi:hypothetical protein